MSEVVITKMFETDTAHRLLNHPGKCRNLHGHRYKWELTLRGDCVDATGMLVDFGYVKKTFGAWLDHAFDHALVLEESDPVLKALESFELKTLTLPCHPTAENFALIAFQTAQVMFRGYPVKVVNVRCWETPTSYADYHEDYELPDLSLAAGDD